MTYVPAPAWNVASPVTWRMVVPGRVRKVPRGFGSVPVQFAFHLYHREGTATISLSRRQRQAICEGSHVYLIATLSGGRLSLEYDPDAAAAAIDSALAAAGDESVPVAEVVGDPPPAPSFQAKYEYELTRDEVTEARMLCGASVLTVEQPARKWLGIIGWIMFGGLALLLFLLMR